MKEQLRKDICEAINRNSIENDSDTPDFALADFLIDCLNAYEAATRAKDIWHGHHEEPTVGNEIV